MGTYCQKVEEMFKKVETGVNTLQKYDNYTYHIQFFMLPYSVYSKFLETRQKIELTKETEEIIKNNKVIIAESGVTSDLSISSFRIDTIPATAGIDSMSTNTKGTLLIDETAGSSLVNKLALLTSLLGYKQSYISVPYFVSIWFTGYPNVGANWNEPPERKIEGKEYVYAFVASDVKNSDTKYGTQYTFDLASLSFISLKKDIALVGESNPIGIKNTFNNTLLDIEKNMNEVYKKRISDRIYDIVYKNKGDPISVNYKGIIGDDSIKPQKNATMIPDRYLNRKEPELNVTNGTINVDPNQSWESVIFNVWNYMSPEGSFLPIIDYKYSDPTPYKGKVYYKVNVDVNLLEIPGLDDIKKGMPDFDYFDEGIEKKQEKYLKACIDKGLIIRNYEYQLSGKNIDVLEYKSKEDHLWLLNVPMVNYVEENTPLKGLDDDGGVLYNKLDDNIAPEIKDVYDGKHGKPIYMSDIISNKDFANNNVSLYYGAIGYDVIPRNQNQFGKEDSERSTESDVVSQETKNYLISKYGARNFLSTGQKLEITLTITGDPYWLEFGCEKVTRADVFDDNRILVESGEGILLPHIIVTTRTFTKPNGNDDYKPEVEMEITTLYKVIEINSTFDGGRFTQVITGVVAMPFTQSRSKYTEEEVKDVLKYKEEFSNAMKEEKKKNRITSWDNRKSDIQTLETINSMNTMF